MKEEQAKATCMTSAFHTHPPGAVRCLSLRSPSKCRVTLRGAELEHRLKAAAGVVHNIVRSLLSAAVGEVLSFTYLIKPKLNRTAVWGF